MKKVLSLVIVSVLALSVVACTKKTTEEAAPAEGTTPVEQPAAPAEAAPAQQN